MNGAVPSLLHFSQERSDHVARNKSRRSKRYNSRRDANVINFNEYTPQKTRKKKVEIIPRNEAQEEYIFNIEDNIITFGIGPAGTGKTLIATLMGIQALKTGEVEKIVITRPAVSVDEQHGFLPGSLIEKMAPWTRPIFDVFEEYYAPKHIAAMVEDGVIEVSPLAYMRGRTFKNAWIIADEMQNALPSQMKMVLTRIGENSKMVVTGDLDQHDRGFEENGLRDFVERLQRKNSDRIGVINFQQRDVERNPIVTEVLEVYKD